VSLYILEQAAPHNLEQLSWRYVADLSASGVVESVRSRQTYEKQRGGEHRGSSGALYRFSFKRQKTDKEATVDISMSLMLQKRTLHQGLSAGRYALDTANGRNGKRYIEVKLEKILLTFLPFR
jgi:hypothetical protein